MRTCSEDETTRSRILFYPFNLNLACHFFMDGGKRHETPGLEEKDFMHSTAWSMVISMSVNSHEGNREGPDGWLHTQ